MPTISIISRVNFTSFQGKTIRSREDSLEEKISKFRQQEEEVKNLDVAFRDYVAALETVKKTEMKLMSTWAINIQDWENLENFLQNAQAIQEGRSKNIESLEKDVIVPMMTYRQQFAEFKRRIDKCEAKRIQFDRESFLLHQLETTNGNNEQSLKNARDKEEKSKDVYNALVQELSDTLPDLYSTRRELYATNLQTLFNLQKYFHNEISYIFRDMSEYVLVKLKSD